VRAAIGTGASVTDGACLSVREALRRHYLASGLPADGGRSGSHWTMLRVAGIAVRLPNFAWRRRALPLHDIHHLVTGYPCSVSGELQIAAWEFAAGRYPHVMATLFCLPLLAIGAIGTPRRSFAAYVRGRSSRTLYRHFEALDVELMDVDTLQRNLVPARPASATPRDRIAWMGLALCSMALVVTPLAILGWALSTL
jgi:hypothetical protein